jgi:hypothetical protein
MDYAKHVDNSSSIATPAITSPALHALKDTLSMLEYALIAPS